MDNYLDTIEEELYDDYFHDKSVWQIYFKVAFRQICPLLDPGSMKIADVGCGTGKWSRELCSLGHKLTLVDISQKMIELAALKIRREFPDGISECYTSDICNMTDIANEGFDAVFSMGDPLSYCNDFNKGMSELVRICKPGGLIVVSLDYRPGYFRVFRKRKVFDAKRILDFIDNGNIIGLEGLPIHAFTIDSLVSKFENLGAEHLNSWTIPKVISNFDEDNDFLEKLKCENFFNEMVYLEHELIKRDFPMTAPGHLYAVFRKK